MTLALHLRTLQLASYGKTDEHIAVSEGHDFYLTK